MPGDVCRSFRSESAHETLALAGALGSLLTGGEVLALAGGLGAGKTTFTKGLCAGLGLEDSRLVSSPTYVLEHIYEARVPVRHYDAYRLSCEDELLALGFQEHLGGRSVLVIEWADKFLSVLPPERLLVELSIQAGDTAGTRRRIDLSGPRVLWGERLERIRGTKQ